jgi:hypothetical protein
MRKKPPAAPMICEHCEDLIGSVALDSISGVLPLRAEGRDHNHRYNGAPIN